MSPGERRFVTASTIAVAGTGLVYAFMRYLLEPAEPWDVVNHPWQPHLQHLHVLFAPLLVFACGLIWKDHVLARTNGEGRARNSGLLLAWTAAPMILTGGAIQVATSEGWRKAAIAVHLIASAVWLLGFVAHRVLANGRVNGREALEAVAERDGT